MTSFNGTRVPSRIKVEKIMAALQRQPMSAAELAEIVHCVPRTALYYVNLLRAEKRIYRQAVRKNGKARTAVYAPGNFKDAPMPKPMPKAVSNRKYWKALSADSDRYLTATRAKRIRRALANVPAALQPGA